MENKELKVNIPEGYEIDRENSTLECIKFKPKGLTYRSIAATLFCEKDTYFLGKNDNIEKVHGGRIFYSNRTNATSERQLEKLFAINQLMNVAKYLNGDWKPNFDTAEEPKYYIFIESDKTIEITYSFTFTHVPVYFKTEELAEQAIKILGEDTIKLAFSTDW